MTLASDLDQLRIIVKIDLKTQMKLLYQRSAENVVEIDVPAMAYMMIDGEGDPNSSKAYSDAIEALFTVSYGVKFMFKKGPTAVDYGAMPLEGLWWADDMSKFSAGDKSGWKWTMMIMQPAFVTRDIIDRAIADVSRKKNLAALAKMRAESLTEGRCANPAYRPLLGRGARGREAASLHRRTRQAPWKAPRNLPERHSQGCSREMEDRDQATDAMMVDPLLLRALERRTP